MIAARKFISDLLFIKYLVLRWEINIRKGERDPTREKRSSRRGRMRCCRAGWNGMEPKESLHLVLPLLGQRKKVCMEQRWSKDGTVSPFPPMDARTQDWDYPISAWGLHPPKSRPPAPAAPMVCAPAPPAASHPCGLTPNLL